jgi:signal transduction histidine kinase
MKSDHWEVIHRVHQLILQADSLETLGAGVQAVLDQIHNLIPFSTAQVLVYDLAVAEASILVTFGREEQALRAGVSWPIPEPYRYYVPSLVTAAVDPKADAWLPPAYIEALRTGGMRTWRGAHLVDSGSVIGSLVLAGDRHLRLSPDQKAMLQSVGEALTIALRQSNPGRQTEDRANEMETIVTISTSLRKARLRSEMYPIFTTALTQALHADVGVLLMLEDDGLSVKASIGVESIVGRHFEVGLGAFWQVLRESAPVFATIHPGDPDFDGNPLWQALTEKVHALAIIPLTTTDQAVGLFFLGRFRPELFSVLEVRELNAVAELGGNAFNRAAIMETLEQRVKDRTRAIATLYDIAASANTSASVQDVLVHALDEALIAFQCSHGMIHLVDIVHMPDKDRSQLHLAVQRGWPAGNFLTTTDWFTENPFWRWIEDQREPLWIPDSVNDPRTSQSELLKPSQAYLGVPIQSHGRIVGILSLMGKAVMTFSRDDFSLATMIADQLGILLESYRSRKLAEENAVIEERQRLARDLHDSVTQSLYSLVFLSESWRRAINNGQLAEAHLWPDELEKIAHQALKEMRLLLYELRPVDLDKLKLAEALRQRLITVEERSSIHAEISVTGEDFLPSSLTHELYQIAHEALNNILKHAACTRVSVALVFLEDSVTLEISDNGRGFDLSSVDRVGGLGLRGMQERVKRMAGTLEIDSQPGSGTHIMVQVSW